MRHAGCLTWNVYNSRMANSIFITDLGISHQEEPTNDAKTPQTLHDENEEVWQVSHLGNPVLHRCHVDTLDPLGNAVFHVTMIHLG